MEYGYVCWPCRTVASDENYSHDRLCKNGHRMQYVAGRNVPRHRDDHKMWRLAEEKIGERPRRRRRRAVKMAQWEKQLLKASK